LVGAAVVGVVAIVIAMSSSGGEVVDGPQTALGTHENGSDAPLGALVVDVAGAVANPGIYRLPTGSRVGDAIDAAGGFSPRVDVARVGSELNLAATLADGTQVRVPSRDDPAATSASSGTGGGGLVNLNTATEAELDALSGIGPVTAQKIIDSRESAPFRTVDELRERSLVGQKTYDKIRAQLTVD
jgi:competence protein ComEA